MKLVADDLFNTPLDQVEIDLENEGGETYICGNPPYVGATVKAPKRASREVKERLKKEGEIRKSDMKVLSEKETSNWKSLDYVSGWFMQFSRYAKATQASCAFVTTNSVTQGAQVARLWPLVLGNELRIEFAHTSFKWANLAIHNAGVTVVIIGLSAKKAGKATIYEETSDGIKLRKVDNINSYLIPYRDVYVEAESSVLSKIVAMTNGSKPAEGGHLILSQDEVHALVRVAPKAARYVRPVIGTEDTIHGHCRYCLWIRDEEAPEALAIPQIKERTDLVVKMRSDSPKELTNEGAKTPWAFQEVRQRDNQNVILVPRHSSEVREFLPVSFFSEGA